MPAYHTERGVLTGQSTATEEEEEFPFLATATLSIPAPQAILASNIKVVEPDVEEPYSGKYVGQAAETVCRGSAATPTAAPGYVCLYPTIATNVLEAPVGTPIATTEWETTPVGGAGAGKLHTEDAGSRYGFGVRWKPVRPGLSTVSFVWAYTAPAAGEETASPHAGTPVVSVWTESGARIPLPGEVEIVEGGWNRVKNQGL